MWIDAHIHIYDVSREGVFWPTPANRVLYRKISSADFVAAAGGCGVSRAIAVECASEVENNIWTFESLKDVPEICAVTGHINPCSDRFSDIYSKFRGIRMMYTKVSIAGRYLIYLVETTGFWSWLTVSLKRLLPSFPATL